jgi:hypothetical protein
MLRKQYSRKEVIILRLVTFILSQVLLMEVFNSGFSEGQSNSIADSVDNTLFEKRRIIKTSENYQLFYSILYYLYTEVIVFDTDPNYPSEESLETPSDVESIYAAADRMLLTDLKEKALDFLRRTCSIENITTRVFGHTASAYEELNEIYASYFKKHLEEVIQTLEYQEFFQELEESSDISLKLNISSKFRKLVEDRFKDNSDSKERKRN